MRLRLMLPIVIAGLVIGCGGESGGEAAADAEAAEMAAPSADELALEQVRADYVTHYNLHHASMVADLFSDSSVFLQADGGIYEGKDGITASLEATMAGSPTLSLETTETMVVGDQAVAIGAYTVQTTAPEVGAVNMAGTYLTHFHRENDAWKISAVITNYNAPPPAGLPAGTAPDEAPPDNGTLEDVVSAYVQHFNLGHPDMVAALYTDDARVSFSNDVLLEGKAAVQAALAERMATGSPKIEIHDVATMELGDGWLLDGGWYRLTATPPEGSITQEGTYMTLVRTMPDGTRKIHWSVTNGQPVTGM